jgi:AcrR family transcriptional regulator
VSGAAGAGEPPPSTREVLLREAAALVQEEGIEALSMRRLASRVGVSATALYRHFPDKDGLLRCLVEGANAELGRYLFPRGRPRPRLEGTLAAYLRFALERPQSYDVLFFSRGRTDLEVPPSGESSANFRLLRDQVAEAMARGELRRADPTQTAVTLWALMHGLVALHRQGRFGDRRGAFGRVFRRAVAQLLAGLKPAAGAPRS